MPQKITTKNIGDTAEQVAEHYLLDHGLKLMQRNFRSKRGEIDLIMNDRDTVVFVEVKFRKNALFGQPYETVTKPKQQKIILTAKLFLQQHKHYAKKTCRFDIISILDDEITWLKHAFE